MIKGKTVLAIIPARGGSKGLPRKNILPLAGKPLIGWTIEAVKNSKYVDRIIVSTEDNEIADISKSFGADIPFLRPKFLAQDDTPSMDVVIHAINKVSDFDYVLLLQPTSPLRTNIDIDKCIKKCILNNALSCISVVAADKSPYWMYTINQNGSVKPILVEKGYMRRQDLPMVYVLNGAIYFVKIDELIKTKQFVTEKSIAYIMPKTRSIDIDTELDFKFIENILNYKY
jgi:CMP-N,N'-diacetyllegionaminic acid synthase